MPWAIPVTLLPDESISSWLARAALMQGCDPSALTGAICPGWQAWSLDTDRGIPHECLRALSEASGIPKSRMEAAALRKDAEKIFGEPPPDSQAWPWILALGSRNRSRRGGLQFCPICLARDTRPYFRRQWRFAWHTGCPQHGISLQDRCGACGAPIEPHRLQAEDRHLALCARCKCDLREADRKPISETALAFQRLADDALNNSTGSFGETDIPTTDWFSTAAFLIAVVRKASRSEASKLAGMVRSLGIQADGGLLQASGLPFELLTVRERQILLDAAFRLIVVGPEELRKAFWTSGITKAALRNIRGALPSPVNEIILSLPDGSRGPRKASTPRSAGPRSKRAVMAAWRRLQRKMWA